MNQPISRQAHGLADLTYIPTVAAAPKLFGFEEEKTAVATCYALSGMALMSGLMTRAEWGVFKVLPFKAHIALDFVNSVTALAAPWLFGFAHNEKARNAFLAMGAVGLTAGLLTRPEEMPEYQADEDSDED
ncbi:hypothetical protein LJ737_05880 [Hymenobacter sp. 15J16-1T3B]|uniref:hypothetical protein n=1 Tax=Hymenobacter sp. 15J16-1T3B TaxID=2886941 RepID=UPI001D13018F|nr:hypothetical protein [Hymenobacter sp. 15J16-1T3B]MCC3156758.1 hypothetical protein [Hymenobacter sp. 15J16-1T3B]